MSTIVLRTLAAEKRTFASHRHRPKCTYTPPTRPPRNPTRSRAPPRTASACAEPLLALPHIIERVSTRTCRERLGSPHEAHGATRAARRATTPLGGLGATQPKAADRGAAAHRVALTARGRLRLVEAYKGVEQAHPVSGGRIREGARARGADGSTGRGGPVDAR